MGKRGPTAAPTHLKVLRGDQERHINREAPVPTDEPLVIPPDMSAGARVIWDELAADLQDKGCLTHWDVHLFAAFCEAVATYRECRILMGDQFTDRGAAGGVIKSPYWQIMRDCVETMVKLSSRFGLSPGDRSALTVGKGQDGPKQGAERILG